MFVRTDAAYLTNDPRALTCAGVNAQEAGREILEFAWVVGAALGPTDGAAPCTFRANHPHLGLGSAHKDLDAFARVRRVGC